MALPTSRISKILCEPREIDRILENVTKGTCAGDRDRVARRLAAAEAARRADYEQEVRRAGDAGAPGGGPCSPSRPLSLQSDDACRVAAARFVDPCAHHPRVHVEVAPRPAPTPAAGRGRPPCERRGLHTSCRRAAAEPPAPGVEAVLRERAELREAARGRSAGCPRDAPARAANSAQVTLEVPPRATRVDVRVSVGDERGPTFAACRPPSDTQTSWLSSIRRKLTKKPERPPSNGKDGKPMLSPKCPVPPPPPSNPAPAPPRHPCPPRPPCPPRAPLPAAPESKPASGKSKVKCIPSEITTSLL